LLGKEGRGWGKAYQGEEVVGRWALEGPWKRRVEVKGLN